jgi:DNA-binding transcriptional regulator LsrR (DeoR family)
MPGVTGDRRHKIRASDVSAAGWLKTVLGYSNHEIAQALGVSAREVKRILAELGEEQQEEKEGG